MGVSNKDANDVDTADVMVEGRIDAAEAESCTVSNETRGGAAVGVAVAPFVAVGCGARRVSGDGAGAVALGGWVAV
jgi:hypothetical protein